ncbi:DUF3592 domain-containing protein [Neorhodopirellula pilleata]|uniref:DUF3592 domain-containing protein n=1 Tax=Neorhodopirellula pilleata TaxID=2714738 RepID=A0A5C6A5X8_9BACT|nr:hypothetical protein Pla100_34820 [Neorhodopirellula pilleata]
MALNRKNTWIGFAFIVAGLIPAGLNAWSVWNWFRARSWNATDATVVSVELRSQSSTGPRGRSSSSTKLFAEYEYEWEGTKVKCTSVSPFNNIEIFKTHKRKLTSALGTARRQGKTVTCYVNPDNPHEAFLEREFRWASFAAFSTFTIVFMGSGVLIEHRRRR